MKVKITAVADHAVTAEIVASSVAAALGQVITISLNRMPPNPAVGDILWHVEHHYWDNETQQLADRNSTN